MNVFEKLAMCGKKHGKKKVKVPPQYLSKIGSAFEEELSKIAMPKKTIPGVPSPVTVKKTVYGKQNPSKREGYMKVRKFPSRSLSVPRSGSGFSSLPPAEGKNPLL
jgi:hypothetical protein